MSCCSGTELHTIAKGATGPEGERFDKTDVQVVVEYHPPGSEEKVAETEIQRIGLTKVHDAADGMEINFDNVTTSHFTFDATNTAAVASATSLTAAENAAVNAFGGAGVVYFSFHGNEYFIATANHETVVSSGDAIVELVGITGFHSPTLSGGVVALA